MNTGDARFLLLTGKLGDPKRRPLTLAQVDFLTQRMRLSPQPSADAELSMEHLSAIGLSEELSSQILDLLDDQLQLDAYLLRGQKADCFPITRENAYYPMVLRRRLGNRAPGCIWMKGDPTLLTMKRISLVGSRDLMPANREFAREVGRQAAKQGYVLVSGNARGADRTAQNACLNAGGYVISVVADALQDHPLMEHVLYLSEEDFDEAFSAKRALQRNRIIHCLGEYTFVAQARLGQGGTWSGSVQNLQKHWSPLLCFRDYSEASLELERMGAELISFDSLLDFKAFSPAQQSLF